jgi:mono/diheme cytochrome c family protein
VVGLAAAALLALAGGIALIARSRSSRLRLLGGAGMLVVCGGLVFGLVTRANAQPRQAQPTAQIMPTGATGQQLFLAKGCVVCHVNERALANSAQFGVGSGPDLSAYRNDAAFLQTWLKDPQAVKANTEMPNLGLKAEEIEALVKFINGEE